MDSKKVYVTRKIPGPALSILSTECMISLNNKPGSPSRREIMKGIRDKDALLCMLSDKIDAELMDTAPNLKVISTYSTGFEHIDIKQASQRGIYVIYTADILTESTADLTFALILACSRNIVKADNYVRRKRWKIGWTPDLMLGSDVYGATLGIIGLGKIGEAVAKRAKGFGMSVLYYNHNRKKNIEDDIGIKYVLLEELLAESDFVSIHVNLNEQNHHLIDKGKLSLMKKTAFLINTSRGSVVNEQDLIRALNKGNIGGAGLDVFEREPITKTSPLLKMNNVVLLPHIGSASYETRSKMGVIAVKNLLDVLNGKEPDPKFVVNPEVIDVSRQRTN
jgi:glyoxylate reductase